MHPLEIAGVTILPGQRCRLEIPVARLPTGTSLSLPVEAVCGDEEGARLFLTGAVHGDELNGVEIVRRVMEKLEPRKLAGVVIAVPIVNVFGFIDQSRYLPDRRDLNRCFPGSARGSLAARLAHLVMSEVVGHCSHGIDLHTGANHRTNLPQIRGDLSDAATLSLAEAFAAPVMVNARIRDGSLRWAASEEGKTILVFEGGEPLRFNRSVIDFAVKGVFRVLAELGMYGRHQRPPSHPSLRIDRTTWVRARRSGILRMNAELGQHVEKDEPLAVIANAFGADSVEVAAPESGVIIGHTNNPLVHQGDPIMNLGVVPA